MASHATAASTSSSNTENVLIPGGAASSNANSRMPVRQMSASKGIDGGRKQTPVDMASRRGPAQKAWTPGTNPLTQRGNTSSQPNGSSSQPRQPTSSKMGAQKEIGLSDKHAHDRLTFILGAALGLMIIVTTKQGEQFEGVFAGSVMTPNNTKITLKMSTKVQSTAASRIAGRANREAALVGTSPDYAMNFDMREVLDVNIPSFTMPSTGKSVNGTNAAFQTDTDISGNLNRGERALQRWVPDGPENTDFSLDSGLVGHWDQFATNDRITGASSTYDENLYTTTIDRSAPSYKRREAEAARIAREIEGQSSTNAHIREERGQAQEGDGIDEESKYSGVDRNERAFQPLAFGAPNKYTPPARRPLAAQSDIPDTLEDSAVITAQVAKPDKSGSANKSSSPEIKVTSNTASPSLELASVPSLEQKAQNLADETPGADTNEKIPELSDASAAAADKASHGVEHQVLTHFRHFKELEKQKLNDKKKAQAAQANQDRTAKLNELLRFSKTFKLKTPVPQDLVGILAKDPVKQDAIIDKAQRESEESTTTTNTTNPSVNATPSAPSSNTRPAAPVTKFDASQVPGPIPERSAFNRARGGYTQTANRGDRSSVQQPAFAGRGTSGTYNQRPGTQVDRKSTQPVNLPAPIPIHEGRMPPSGPMADLVGPVSPQRSNLHTPPSTVSAKFNVKAMEFRPSAAAPSFNPGAATNPPSTPSVKSRHTSISRSATPSTFFGSRKPILDRPSLSKSFGSVNRMKKEQAEKKNAEKSSRSEDGPKEKDFTANGGIPNAYMTGPRWNVKAENIEKTYNQMWERPTVSVHSPNQIRSASAQHMNFQHPMPHLQNGGTHGQHMGTTQHQMPAQQYQNHYEDGHYRMPHMAAGTPQVYPSPSVTARQLSNYASPMAHPSQLTYAQPPYFGAPQAQGPMQMRTPGMMHAQPAQMAAPMMVQQASSGPYMPVPSFNPQMQMYSPSPSHVHLNQNGYPSPQRVGVAPMMMHQGSQPGHHQAPVMFGMPGQAAPMMYPQQGQMAMRGGYPAPYGSSPHGGHPLQHRTMSSGYNQMNPKVMQQQMSHHNGTVNGTLQGYAHPQMETNQEQSK